MKKILTTLFCAALLAALCGCGQAEYTGVPQPQDSYRTYYEIFVGSFYDSDGDGMGDLNGIAEKLDYLNDNRADSNQSLHVTGIWLMPIMPSPTYHKYDVTDYYSVAPEYGTAEDFSALAQACHERGIAVIIDLPVNHTSNQHPWFVSAAASAAHQPCGQEECIYSDLCIEHNELCSYYNFSDKPLAGYSPVPGASVYYEARFWSGMPDLNLDTPAVRSEISRICEYWLDLGADGFRLDAVTSYYTGASGKNAEFLSWINSEIKSHKPDAYIVAEAWDSAEEIAGLYSSGIDSFFNFPWSQASGSIIRAVGSGLGAALANRVEIWGDTLSEFGGAIDAPFLSNHDMTRSAGALRRDLTLQKQAAAVYLLLPGNPFIYYGEEIGMGGGSSNDESKRTSFVWSAGGAPGTTDSPAGATVEQLEAGVDEQLDDAGSLLRFYIEVLKIRNAHPEIPRGSASAVDAGNDSVYAVEHSYNGVSCLVVHNLSSDEAVVEFEGYSVSETLAAGGEAPTQSGNRLTLPAHSTAVLIPVE